MTANMAPYRRTTAQRKIRDGWWLLACSFIAGCGGGGGGTGSSNVAARLVTFQSNRDGDTEIFLMNADGTAQTQLTKNSVPDGAPSLSPDRRKIVFESLRPGNRSRELYIMDADGTNQKRLTTNDSVESDPVFSPDGSSIAYSSDRGGKQNIYSLDLSTLLEQQLTFSPSGISDTNPNFTPDGRLVFATGAFGTQNIVLLNAPGAVPQHLTNDTRNQSQPVVSPDGKTVVFTTGSGRSSDLYQVNIDGTNEKRLTTNPEFDGDPVFSPDGERIVFTASTGGNFEIYLLDTGSVQNPAIRLTTRPGIDRRPDIR